MTRSVVALVIVILTTVVVRRLGGPTEVEIGSIGLGLGFALIAAGLVGRLFERAHLPRVTGYLLFGLACGPYVANIISRPMARGLQVVNGLAVALIAFIAGLELNPTQLRRSFKALLGYGAIVLGAVFLGTFALLVATWPWLPIYPDAGWWGRIALAALLALIITSLSPTVTIAVIAESRARGDFTDFVMGLTILTDFVIIVAFTVLMQPVRWAVAEHVVADVGLLTRLAWEIVGSLAFGAMVGSLFAIYLRHVGREITVALVGVCVVLSTLARHWHLEPILAAVTAGLVVENIAPPRGIALRDAVERGALPILIIFFAATGASLQLDALAAMGAMTIMLASVRVVLLIAGTKVASSTVPAALPLEHRRLLWMALVSQAGITLGLAAIVGAEFPTWGQAMWTLIVGLVTLHELAGPVLLRTALARAGDIGRER